MGVRVYKVQDKNDLFSDEYLTILISNYIERGLTGEFAKQGVVYEGKELKQMLFSTDNSFSSIVGSVQKLRGSTRDSSHPNLYYSLFKASLWCVDSSDLDKVIFRGFLLNLLLSILGFYFLYKLAVILFTSQIVLILGALGLAFFFEISVGNTLFLRPYQLQETLFIIVSYLFASFCIGLHSGGKVISISHFLVGSLVLALFLLTGYFSIPYVGLLFMAAILYAFYIKRRKCLRECLFFCAILIAAMGLTYLIYPLYYVAVFVGRGEEALDKYSIETLGENISICLQSIGCELENNCINLSIFFVVVGLIIYFFYKKRFNLTSNEKASLLLITSSVFWLVFIYYSSPYKAARYISSAFPIAFLIIPLSCLVLSRKRQSFVLTLFSGLFLLNSFLSNSLYWSMPTLSQKYCENVKSPLVISGMSTVDDMWKRTGLAALFTDGREIHFLLDESWDGFQNYDSIYLVGEKGTAFVDNAQLKGYQVQEKFYNNSHCEGFFLKKKE